MVLFLVCLYLVLRVLCVWSLPTLVVSSVPSILAVFGVYSLYDRGSGAKLNYGKCEGLWLGCWNGCTDSPVNITWSSVKVKVLGVFLGLGNLEEDNWRPRITALENALNSWRQRSLSYKGKLFSSMPWPFPVCGKWPLLSMFPGGSVLN